MCRTKTTPRKEKRWPLHIIAKVLLMLTALLIIIVNIFIFLRLTHPFGPNSSALGIDGDSLAAIVLRRSSPEQTPGPAGVANSSSLGTEGNSLAAGGLRRSSNSPEQTPGPAGAALLLCNDYAKTDWTVGFEIELFRVEFVPCVASVLMWAGSHGGESQGDDSSDFPAVFVTVEGRGNDRGPLYSKPEIHHTPLGLTDALSQRRFYENYSRLIHTWRERSAQFTDNNVESVPFPGTRLQSFLRSDLKKKHEIYFQYSVGLPLSEAGMIVDFKLRFRSSRSHTRTFNSLLIERLSRTKGGIVRAGVCAKEYVSFLALAGHHLSAATGDRTHNGGKRTAAAKFYARQLIVKTNFGEIFEFLTRNLDAQERIKFLEEQVRPELLRIIGGTNKDMEMYRYGCTEYCYSLPHYAAALNNSIKAATDEVAARQIVSVGEAFGRAHVRYKAKKCPVYYGGHLGGRLYVSEWISALSYGRDITSDRHSYLPPGTVVFKNMGKGGLLNDHGGVLVELRMPGDSYGYRHLALAEKFPDTARGVFTTLQRLREDRGASRPVL